MKLKVKTNELKDGPTSKFYVEDKEKSSRPKSNDWIECLLLYLRFVVFYRTGVRVSTRYKST